jgi:protoheme IX farnesyltransferase
LRTNAPLWLSVVLQKVEDYKLLVKFRLSLLVVFSALGAFFIAKGGAISFEEFAVLGLGGFFVTGAANALNQILEKDYDRLMQRTANRPLPTGRMSVPEAILSAGLMSIAGLALLASFNPMTSVLGSLSLLMYAFVYTPMKRVSPVAVLIGAVPGALPMMIGCVAAEGGLTGLAIVLFGIQFLWQFPHFWAIAWVSYEDYARAGFFLLPSPNGQRDKNTGLQSMFYAIGLVFLGFLPYLMGVVGIVSTVVLLASNLAYIYYAWKLYQDCSNEAARRLMFCSFFYLPVAMMALALGTI